MSVTRLLPALSPALCRAARGALDWTQEDLAKRSTISRTTVRDYESCRHVIHRRTASLITAAFEREGLVLTQLPEVGFGIWKFECDSPGSQAELLKALF
nr:helix-turn-helix transcriptional regulator [Neorhizobium sp. T25_13]